MIALATRAGPTQTVFGTGSGPDFVRWKTIPASSTLIVARTQWTAFEEDMPVRIAWRFAGERGGGGIVGEDSWTWKIQKGWHTTHFNVRPSETPMSEGAWELVIRRGWDASGPVMGRFRADVAADGVG
jgi:hypothetical protein